VTQRGLQKHVCSRAFMIENGSCDQAPTQMDEHLLQFQEERGHLKYTKKTWPPITSSYFFTMHAALQCLRITTIIRTDTAAEIVVATADYSHTHSRRTPAKSSARHDRARTTPGTQLSLSLSLSLSLRNPCIANL
jgi:outer membrane protein W